jgi:hypothetical protein
MPPLHLDTLPAMIPFWKDWPFWISSVIGIAGLVFSFLAFREAKQAKRAATEAGRTVKIQTVAIELTEILQGLDSLDPAILYNEARDFISTLSRRLRRLVSPFQNDPDLATTVTSIRETLTNVKAALNSVRPTAGAAQPLPPNAVYNAVESDLVTINGFVADLLGLLEAKSFTAPVPHA